MNAPQIIYIVLVAMGLTVSIVRDGEPKGGRHCFLTDVISAGLVLLLLWWGGFFGGGA